MYFINWLHLLLHVFHQLVTSTATCISSTGYIYCYMYLSTGYIYCYMYLSTGYIYCYMYFINWLHLLLHVFHQLVTSTATGISSTGYIYCYMDFINWLHLQLHVFHQLVTSIATCISSTANAISSNGGVSLTGYTYWYFIDWLHLLLFHLL